MWINNLKIEINVGQLELLYLILISMEINLKLFEETTF